MRFKDYKTFRTAIGGRLLQVEVGKVAGMATERRPSGTAIR